MSQVDDWVKAAEAQGWRVTSTADNQRCRFIPPDQSISAVVVSRYPSPADLRNSAANLRRAGLTLPGDRPKRKEPTTMREDASPTVEAVLPKAGPPSRGDTIEATLAHALELIDVLGEEFGALRVRLDDSPNVTLEAHRAETDEQLVELRGRLDALREQLRNEMRDCVAMAIAEVRKDIAAMIQQAALKADPVGAFRSRLRGEPQ